MPEIFEIYVVRHAIAEMRGEAWPDDSKRPLSEAGILRMRKNARGLLRLGVEIDVILTSPLVRARQTAEILAATFDVRPPLVVSDALAPGGAFDAAMADLEKQS